MTCALRQEFNAAECSGISYRSGRRRANGAPAIIETAPMQANRWSMANRALYSSALFVAVVLGCSGGERDGARGRRTSCCATAASTPSTPSAAGRMPPPSRDGGIVARRRRRRDRALRRPATRVVDLAEHMALPGLHDSHVHPIRGGELAARLLARSPSRSIRGAARQGRRVRGARARRMGGRQQLRSRSLSRRRATPTKSVLDAVIADRPVLPARLGRSFGLGRTQRAASSRASMRSTPDPPKGVIERDPQTGELQARCAETANELIEAQIPEADAGRERGRARKRRLREMASVGITSFIDAWVNESQLADVCRGRERGRARRARVRTCLVYGVYSEHQGEDFERVLEVARRPTIRLRSTPLPSSSSSTACSRAKRPRCSSPISTAASASGEAQLRAGRARRRREPFRRHGMQVHMHAIGDRAVRAGLDAVAEAEHRNGNT